MPSISPEMALSVAGVALVGTLVNALVSVYNARKRAVLERDLAELGSELAARGDERLERIKHEFRQEIAALEHRQAMERQSVDAAPDRMRLLLPALEEFRREFDDPRIDDFWRLSVLFSAGAINVSEEVEKHQSTLQAALDACSALKKRYVERYRPYFLPAHRVRADEACAPAEAAAARFAASCAARDQYAGLQSGLAMQLAVIETARELRNLLDEQVAELRSV